MPIDRRHINNRAPLEPNAHAKRCHGDIRKRDDTAQQMQPVQARQQVEERAVRMAVDEHTLGRELSPGHNLPHKKSDAEQRGQAYPPFEARVLISLQRSASKLDADAAQEQSQLID